MKFNDGCLVVAEGTVSVDSAHATLVRVPDARSHCRHARENGARILAEPTDYPFGKRQYNVEDFAGHPVNL